MAVQYQVLAGETLAIRGPANVRVTGGEVPVVGDPATAATPVLNLIDPATAEVGGADFTLTASGSGFTASSVIVLGLVDVTTAFVDDATLTATISPTMFLAGAVPVTVRNGPMISEPKDLTFSDPVGAVLAKKRRV